MYDVCLDNGDYLNGFCRLKHKDVFTLIQKHNLYSVIHNMIVELMDLDYEKTISLLLEKDRIPSEIVVEKLQNHEFLLFRVPLQFYKSIVTLF